MEYLVENFQSFAGIYMQVLIEAYMALVAVLFAFWLKPFTLKKKAAWIAALAYYVLQVLNTHLEAGKGVDRLLVVGAVILAFVVVWLLDDKRNPMQKFFLCVIFKLISWLSLEILVEIGMYESKLVQSLDWYMNSAKAMVIEYIVWNPFQYGMALLLLYFTVRILHKAYQHKETDLGWQEMLLMLAPAWSLLLVKPIMSSYFLLWMDGIESGSIEENIPGDAFRLMFSICSLLSIVAIIVLYQRLNESREKAFATKSLKKQMDDMRCHMEQVEQMQEKVRALKHDMGNHLSVILRLSENGEKKELEEYIGSLRETYKKTDFTIKTGNPVTDVILSEYAGRFHNAGIGYEFDFKYPDGTKINAFDVSVILTNALQNALEASGVYVNPCVKVKSVIHDNVFIINVRNCTSRKIMMTEEGIPITTKKTQGHGYGLKNIRSIAGKYKGDIEIRQENIGDGYEFVLNVMLVG